MQFTHLYTLFLISMVRSIHLSIRATSYGWFHLVLAFSLVDFLGCVESIPSFRHLVVHFWRFLRMIWTVVHLWYVLADSLGQFQVNPVCIQWYIRADFGWRQSIHSFVQLFRRFWATIVTNLKYQSPVSRDLTHKRVCRQVLQRKSTSFINSVKQSHSTTAEVVQLQ